MELKTKEVKALYVVLRLIEEGVLVDGTTREDEGLPLPLRELQGVKRKLKKELPKDAAEDADLFALRLRSSDFNRQPDDAVLRAVEKAILGQRRLSITYFSPESDEMTHRRVDLFARNARYAVGYCHLRHAMRKFRLSRILKARPTAEQFIVPAGFDKKDYL